MALRQATLAALTVAAIAAPPLSQAHEAGDMLLRVGVSTVDPKSDNNPVVDVDSGTTLTFNGTWFLTDNWGLEVLAALPFNHDIELKDGTKVGETDHLPPTFSVQYHFLPDGTWQPYVGAGVNATVFFDESTTGPLAGADLSLDTSFGLAGQVGLDIVLNPRWVLNVEARWIDISTDAEVDGVSIGDVDIEPWVYGINVGYSF
ncbi:MAG: OmpW family outer membrane protein [Pseudomonadota bacterium]